MKICLVSPPDRSKIEEDIEYCYNVHNIPHLGVGYIVSFLQQKGFHAEQYECSGSRISLPRIVDIIVEKQYDVIGISSYDYNSFNIVKLVKLIKKRNPNVFIFLGGYYATLNYTTLLNNVIEIDCCVLGEGEITCYELMHALETNQAITSIKGIAFRENGKVKRNDLRELITDLDMLPFPHRPFISKRGVATLITSRGCYGACTFCYIRSFYKNVIGPKIRFRSAQNVVEEIKYLVQERGVSFINIFDDNFLISSKNNINRLHEICRLIRGLNLTFRFSITVRANDVICNRQMLEDLQSIGLQYIFIGIESFLPRQLELYCKYVTPEENVAALRLTKELGINTDIGFIAFDPFVTLPEVKKNIQKLMDSEFVNNFYAGTYFISLFVALSPVHGSELREILIEKNLISPDNPYGFENQEVKLCYSLMKKWSQYIYDANLKYYLIFKAADFGLPQLEEELYQLKRELMLLDAAFIVQLCDLVMEKKIDENNFEDILPPWLEKIEKINNCFLKAKKELIKYARENKHNEFIEEV